MFFTKKWLSNHIEREHQSFECELNVLEKSSKNNNNTSIKNEICSSPQKPKIDKININIDNNANVSPIENHVFVGIGPGNVGKNDYIIKMLEKIVGQKPIHTKTPSPNQYPN